MVIVCMRNSSMATYFSVPLKKVKFGVNLLSTDHLFLLYRERQTWTEKEVDIEMPVCVHVIFVGLQ